MKDNTKSGQVTRGMLTYTVP